MEQAMEATESVNTESPALFGSTMPKDVDVEIVKGVVCPVEESVKDVGTEKKGKLTLVKAMLLVAPISAILVALAFAFRGWYFANPGGQLLDITKHADIATDIYIVDDVDATSEGPTAMIPAVVGEAPFFHKWFGDPSSKAFHHDGGNPASPDGAVMGLYKAFLHTDGCYELHEWHPSGPPSQMSVAASLEVEHAFGVRRLLVNQSSEGGKWNYMASFNFKKGRAQLTLSNQESKCIQQKPCYTAFDAFRFVYTAPDCNNTSRGQTNAFVFGTITVSVSGIAAFLEDEIAKDAIRNAIAKLANADYSAVLISLSAGTRRLSTAFRSSSVVISYRISVSGKQQPSAVVEVLDVTTAAEATKGIADALSSVGSHYKVEVVDMRVSLESKALETSTKSSVSPQKKVNIEPEGSIDPKTKDSIKQDPEAKTNTEPSIDTTTRKPEDSLQQDVKSTNDLEPQTKAEELNNDPSASVDAKPSCMPATIINDFDSERVTSIISPEAQDLPQQGLEAFRPGRVGQKPYFHDWFGDILTKDFHHDAHINKGLVKVNYTTPISQSGCYLLQEWHLGGNRYCVNYMPRHVPYYIYGEHTLSKAYADQSTNGGQWNTLGLFDFSTSATVIMSNENTNDCLYSGMCYTVFDSLRFVHVGSSCADVDRSEESLNRMSDLTCESSNSLAQLRSAASQGDADPSTAVNSLAKLVEITSPQETTIGKSGRVVKVSWETEGVPDGTDVKISFLHEDEVLAVILNKMDSSSGKADFVLPAADFIQKYSTASSTSSNRFRFRIDVQHVTVELSNGWSNQLYTFSPYFTVEL